MLNERSENILKLVVEKYIESGDPVGASSLTKALSLSPASIRNTLASLVDLGFLAQPHTSAGRIPTDMGYRYYAQALATSAYLDDMAIESLRGAASEGRWMEFADLLKSVSSTLSSLSRQVGMVGVAYPGVSPVRRINFLYVDDYVCMAIVVTDGGEIKRIPIRTEDRHSRSDLEKLTNYFNDRFTHLSIQQIRRLLIKELQVEENRVNNMITSSLFIAKEMERQGLDVKGDQIAIDGAANLILQAREKADLSAIKEIFEAMEEKSRLFSLLSECEKEKGVNLVIGSEAEMAELENYSMISHSFDGDNGIRGALGIIGQKQMDYGHNMALVTYAAREMSERLSKRNKGMEQN